MSSSPACGWADDIDLGWISEMEAHQRPRALERMLGARELAVARVDGERVGYLQLERIWGHVPFISWIVVLAAHRSRGIGTAMVGWLRGALAQDERDANEPYLWSSTEPSNVRSQQWHLRIGFEEAGFLAGINPGGTGEIFYRMRLGDRLDT